MLSEMGSFRAGDTVVALEHFNALCGVIIGFEATPTGPMAVCGNAHDIHGPRPGHHSLPLAQLRPWRGTPRPIRLVEALQTRPAPRGGIEAIGRVLEQDADAVAAITAHVRRTMTPGWGARLEQQGLERQLRALWGTVRRRLEGSLSVDAQHVAFINELGIALQSEAMVPEHRDSVLARLRDLLERSPIRDSLYR